MTDDRVELGYGIMALHEPERGSEAAFNRWYERDHMYSMAAFAPYTMAVGRFVATGALKRLRYPAEGPFGGSSALGSFLSFIWIQAGHLEDQQRWVAEEQKRQLAQGGRTFDRRSVQTVTVHRYLGAAARDEDGVTPEAALDRRYPGLVWTWTERVGDTPLEDVAAALLRAMPEALAGTPVALTLAFTPMPKAPWWPKAAPEVPGVGEVIALVHFLETEPAASFNEHFAKLGASLEAAAPVRTLLVAPFIPTVPGTDTHTDDLW